MADQPNPVLLDRELAKASVRQYLTDALELTVEVVNYGSNLVVRCIQTSERTLVEVVAVGAFVKHVVAALDAIQILASEAAALAGKLQARTLLEASLCGEWILRDDSEKRAAAFYVWTLRRRRAWSRAIIPRTPEQVRLRTSLGDLYRDHAAEHPEVVAVAESEVSQIDEFLRRPKFAELDAYFSKERGTRSFDVPWYRPLGLQSVRAIAAAVGRLAEYDVFYSQDSDVVHASSLRSHLKISEGVAILEPIRGLSGLSGTLSRSLSMAFRTYRYTLERYRPDEVEAYSRLYREEWKARFLGIPQVDTELLPRRTT